MLEEGVQQAVDAAVAVQGDLGIVGLAGLLQLAEAEALTGRLRLRGSGGEQAEVALHRGQPVAASLQEPGVGGIEGRSALLEAFLLPAGSFVLETGAVDAGTPLGDAIALIMDGCRLADEWARLDRATVVAADGPADGSAAARVLAALPDGGCLDDGRRAAGLARVAVTEPLMARVEVGQLLLGDALPAPALPAATEASVPGPTPPRLDYHEALEQGRQHLRARDFDAAESAFEAALSARPDDKVARQNLARLRQIRAEAAQPSPWSLR